VNVINVAERQMAKKKKAAKKKGTAKSSWTYKAWYEKNKEKLSEKRRKRYEEDKKYREKVLAQNKAYRDKKAAEEGERPKPKVRIPKHRRPVSLPIKINGEIVVTQLVHIGAFARAIRRSVPTIHQWERSGLLPKTPYYLKGKNKQERLYTSEMIRVVIGVLSERGTTVSSSDPTFRQEIIDGWKEVGVHLEDE
jgi:hypothetical protein